MRQHDTLCGFRSQYSQQQLIQQVVIQLTRLIRPSIQHIPLTPMLKSIQNYTPPNSIENLHLFLVELTGTDCNLLAHGIYLGLTIRHEQISTTLLVFHVTRSIFQELFLVNNLLCTFFNCYTLDIFKAEV